MKYALKTFEKGERSVTLGAAARSIAPVMRGEWRQFAWAMLAIAATSLANLFGPVIVARTVDGAIAAGSFSGVLASAGVLVLVYAGGFVAQYLQTMLMGGVGRRTLWKLRNAIFSKLGELPVAFFNANKSGDLISRINNDTDKLNTFFSQSLMQFVGNFFIMLGAAVFMLVLDPRLAAASLAPAVAVLLLTRLIGGWVRRTSLASLRSLGGMSAEIEESLANFKVVAAFNRLDYFRAKFGETNETNYKASVRAGIASNTLAPIYGIAGNAAQIAVIAYGIALISSGGLSFGMLVGFLLYVNSFYMPLRQLAAIWSQMQLALASFERISEVLALSSDLSVESEGKQIAAGGMLCFEGVSFAYEDGKEVLHDVHLTLEKGKTYALVGPTGGGKTTTASLMARLYDPTGGTVYLNGRDIRSYSAAERAAAIGFILQEPFLFSGTVGENIAYGNPDLADVPSEGLAAVLERRGLSGLLSRFEKGIDTPVGAADSISLGQKQLIAFMRAVLRDPELLILDEATANIDTVTEQLLEEVLAKLPERTTTVVIAHRLNTIESADDIFFVNNGMVTHAGSFEHALELLMHGKRTS